MLRSELRQMQHESRQVSAERERLASQLTETAAEAERASLRHADECKRLTESLAKRLKEEVRLNLEGEAPESAHSQLQRLLGELGLMGKEMAQCERLLFGACAHVGARTAAHRESGCPQDAATEMEQQGLRAEVEAATGTLRDVLMALNVRVTPNGSLKDQLCALTVRVAAMTAAEREPGLALSEPAGVIPVHHQLVAIHAALTPLHKLLEQGVAQKGGEMSVSEKVAYVVASHLGLCRAFERAEKSTSRLLEKLVTTESATQHKRSGLVHAALVALQSLRAPYAPPQRGQAPQAPQVRASDGGGSPPVAERSLASAQSPRSTPLQPEVTVRPPVFVSPQRPATARTAAIAARPDRSRGFAGSAGSAGVHLHVDFTPPTSSLFIPPLRLPQSPGPPTRWRSARWPCDANSDEVTWRARPLGVRGQG